VNHIDNSTAHIAGEILAENNTVINSVSPYRHDPMTGLLDKTSIVRYAKDKIAENGEDGVVIAMIDLDNFKSVNDTLGHSTGDDVIIRFTEILSSIIGNFGAVGRYGGDEFMAVITKGNTEDELRNMFRSIRTTAQSEFHKIEGSKISVTCSIGSAAYPADGKSYKDVFELADTCVYIAKEYGKNRYIIYCDKVQEVMDTDEMLWEGRNTRAEGNGDLTFRLTSMLFSDGGAEIPNVLEKLGTYYNLTYIRIYTGNEMNLETSWTIATDTTVDNAKYAFNNDYIEKFNLNGIYRIDNIKKLEKMFPDAYESLKCRNVDSAVQYLITDEKEVKGLISFEQIKPATHYWHESEVNNYALIGKLIGQMLIKKQQ
jgi:diguanylate cyclase (GGDEF)-like protein